MSNYYNQTPLEYDQNSLLTETNVISKNFMANVFMWMFVALSLSAVTAYLFSTNIELMSFLYSANGSRNIAGTVLMFLPLIFVLTMSFAYNKLSMPVLAIIFILYSIVNGISFSYILLVYTQSSVVSCFAGAAGMFAIMAVMGYYTKQDLTSFGRLMFMGLIGMIIMSLINMFMHSNMMGYIIGAIGVAVFTGLTAYDIQKLKNIGQGIDENGNTLDVADTKKYAIMGALRLYLDFINLFISLLRLFGGRKN